MIIPTKIIFFGDRARCQSVLGIARSRLILLQERLNRSRGMIKQGWQKPITLTTGEIIRLAVSFNTSVIEVYAEKHDYAVTKMDVQEDRKCFCTCNISIGHVMKVPTESIHGVYFLDVEACYDKKIYIMYENILASDFTKYVEGQKVLVMAYNNFLYECSISLSNATGCIPVESTKAFEALDWLTTYRIIPLCALTIPFWE